MHLAIIDDNDKVFVEFDAKAFLELLIKFHSETGDLKKAFDKVSKVLQDKIRNM